MYGITSDLLEIIQPGVLVVSGSRSIRDNRDFADYAVGLAIKRGWAVLVGDAAGVDTTVIQVAGNSGLPLIVAGCQVNNGLRLDAPAGAHVWLVPGGTRKSCYVIRDQAMAYLASQTENRGMIGLWDGESKGVMHTGRFCRRQGVPGRIVFMGGGYEQWGFKKAGIG